MRKIFYRYQTLGAYQTTDDPSFAEDAQLKVIIEPHDFSISVGGEMTRSSSCSGCVATVSRDGEVVFYDLDNKVIGRTDKGDAHYKKLNLEYKEDVISLLFGHNEVVDYYPNCDGEHDRWGEKWVTERRVSLHLKDCSIEVK